ncbi:laccase [Moniliophthora roreri]|nr:laccase [Moniliophthora roreri]
MRTSFALLSCFLLYWPSSNWALEVIHKEGNLHVANKWIAPDGWPRAAVLAGKTTESVAFPGPLIKAKKGDRLKINVIDHLTDKTMVRATSIHWHGILQRHTNFADGVALVTQCPIIPGESFLYDFHVPDPGTYWYHSHISVQYCDGLRGPLVVYDPKDPYRHWYDVDDGNVSNELYELVTDPLAESTIITISDWYHPTARQLQATLVPVVENSTLINGKGRYPENPTAPLTVIQVHPHKRYRFRLISMSCDPLHFFSIDGHNLTIIEADGQYTKPHTVTTVPLLAAQRYSFVLYADQRPNNYWIRASPDEGPVGYKDGINMAILRYVGAPHREPASKPGYPEILLREADLHALEDPAAPGKPSPGGADYTIDITLGFDLPAHFYMNGVQWIPPVVPVLTQMLSGAKSAQELLPPGLVYTLPRNKTIQVNFYGGNAQSGPHPFHLHGHAFSVVKSADSDAYNFNNPVRRDVTSVAQGNLTVIRFRTDNPGPWFVHCHKDFHLEDGLAVVFAEDPEGTKFADPVPEAWKELCPKYEEFNRTSPNDVVKLDKDKPFDVAGNNKMVNIPKTRRTYCKGKTCKKHTPHKVTQYKKGKDSLFAQGKRRYDRKQSGYGGQTKPVFHKKAKTTKKVVLRLECTVCKYKMQLALKRCKHFELGGEKKTKGAALTF